MRWLLGRTHLGLLEPGALLLLKQDKLLGMRGVGARAFLTAPGSPSLPPGHCTTGGKAGTGMSTGKIYVVISSL